MHSHAMDAQGKLKITAHKTRRVKGHKTDKNSPTIISSDWKCFNVVVPTQRSDLSPCAQLKAPFMPGADNVGATSAVVTARSSSAAP